MIANSIVFFLQSAVTENTSSIAPSAYAVCVKIEDVRQLQPIVYKILQHLIGFAIKMKSNGNTETSANAISELWAVPSHTKNFTPNKISFLMDNFETIFVEPNPEDVEYSRCHSKNMRIMLQMNHRSKNELKQQ